MRAVLAATSFWRASILANWVSSAAYVCVSLCLDLLLGFVCFQLQGELPLLPFLLEVQVVFFDLLLQGRVLVLQDLLLLGERLDGASVR